MQHRDTEQKPRAYCCIDLKSYYASCEAIDRRLDPLTTNLVVADASRTDSTICLAVSPALKALGVPGRPRLFEVKQKVEQINAERLRTAVRCGKAGTKDGKPCLIGESFDAHALAADPALALSFITATPRMARYMEVSSKIYAIYLRFLSEKDIHVYSIDEIFSDLTPYLKTYHMTARELVKTMIREVLYETGITATAGIGTNLYLCKVALDISAKQVPADTDGVRIAELDESSFRYLLWDHRPLTDFWRIGPGTAARLERHNIRTMGELARASFYEEEWLYKTFGIDAEILIDHAFGIEPCTIRHIKEYRPSFNSICEGQVLPCPYSYEKARIIVREMVDSLVFQLVERKAVTDSLTLSISYDREAVDSGSYQGETYIDHYGRKIPVGAHGTAKLDAPSNLSSQLMAAVVELYERITDNRLTIRRVMLDANRIFPDTGVVQMDLFTDTAKLEKEKRLQETMLAIKKKYSKNAILKGVNFEEGATMRERNNQIGGHKK